MKKLHVKTGDTVVVLSGDDRLMKDDNGKATKKIGKVIATSPEEGKVMVEGVNIVSKHTKARKQGETSSIVRTEGAIYACKVQLYCPKCKTGVRTKSVFETKGDKKIKVRVCAKCGEKI